MGSIANHHRFTLISPGWELSDSLLPGFGGRTSGGFGQKSSFFLTWPEIPIFFWVGWVFCFWISVLGLCWFMFLNNLAAAGELLSPAKVPWCYWLENFQSTERSWTQMVALVARRVSDFFCPSWIQCQLLWQITLPAMYQWIGWWENLQETHGFLPWHIGLSCRFSLKPIQWMYGSMVGIASPKDDSFCHPLGSSRSFRFAASAQRCPAWHVDFAGWLRYLGSKSRGSAGDLPSKPHRNHP